MLNKLLNNGKIINLFEIVPMKQLPKSCTKDAYVDVIDYDKTKEIVFFNMSKGAHSYCIGKSCDALKIMPNITQMDFIEIKGVKDFCAYLSNIEPNLIPDKISTQINNFSFKKKLEDSIFLLRIILGINGLKLTNIERDEIFYKIKKDYIIVIDEEIETKGVLNFAATMKYLSETSNIKREIIVQIADTIEKIEIDYVRVSKPKLMSQSKIDNYYKLIDRVIDFG